jgi:hypothetical protein
VEIDAESLGASGSVTAAVIAVVAAGIAIWQARIASSARDAAKDQARSAQEAVAIARAQLRLAEGPRFAVTVTAPPDGVVPWTAITMLEGHEVDATISWERTISCVTFNPDPAVDRRTDTGSFAARLVTNGSTMLPWWAGGIPEDIMRISAKITIEATEVAGERRAWHHAEAMSWEPDHQAS